MAERRGFQLVEEDESTNFEASNRSADSRTLAPKVVDLSTADKVGLNLLTLGLQTLGRRALVAIDNLLTLITVASAFVLWYSIHDPNIQQIVALTIYALLIIAVNVIVRRFPR